MVFKAEVIDINGFKQEIQLYLNKRYLNEQNGFVIKLTKKTHLLKDIQKQFEKILFDNSHFVKIYNLTPITIIDDNDTRNIKILGIINLEKEQNLPFKLSNINSIVNNITLS